MATKPEFSPDQDMMDVSPEDLAEAKRRARATRQYDEIMGMAKPTAAKPRRPKMPAEMPSVDVMGNATGYSKGGMTASARADGIAQRGKTRGTMVMCGGGMARGGK